MLSARDTKGIDGACICGVSPDCRTQSIAFISFRLETVVATLIITQRSPYPLPLSPLFSLTLPRFSPLCLSTQTPSFTSPPLPLPFPFKHPPFSPLSPLFLLSLPPSSKPCSYLSFLSPSLQHNDVVLKAHLLRPNFTVHHHGFESFHPITGDLEILLYIVFDVHVWVKKGADAMREISCVVSGVATKA